MKDFFFQMFMLFRKQCIKLQENNGYFFPLSCGLGILKEISTQCEIAYAIFLFRNRKVHSFPPVSTPLIKIYEPNYIDCGLC